MYVLIHSFYMAKPSNRRTSGKQEKHKPDSTQRHHEASGASPMNAERLKRLYASMLNCRFSQEEIRKCSAAHPLCAGLEAVIAGAAIHLTKEDLVAPNAEGDFIQLAQGKALQEIIDALKDESGELGNSRGPAEELNVAAGMAFACKHLKKPLVTLCVARADHDSEFWRYAVSFCAGRKLPIVFIIARRSEHTDVDLRSAAQQFLPAITVDGNDVVAVYRVAEESTRRARQGWGPSLIECRLEAGKDPLLFMENYLRQRNLWSDAWKEELERSFPHKSHTSMKTRTRK